VIACFPSTESQRGIATIARSSSLEKEGSAKHQGRQGAGTAQPPGGISGQGKEEERDFKIPSLLVITIATNTKGWD